MKLRYSIPVLAVLVYSAVCVSAADVRFIGMSKNQSFTQEDSGDPVSSDNLVFNAVVETASFSAVSETLLTFPSTEDMPLDFNPEDNSYSYRSDTYFFPEDLDADFPTGNYRFQIVTDNDGTKSVTLPFNNAIYPNPPRLNNYTAAQDINPLINFTLRWDAFAGGTTNDFISVEIEDVESEETVFATPDVWKTGALNGKATSVVIPANKLTGPKAYVARIGFYKIHARNRTAYPGVLAASALASETAATINAISVGPTITIPPQSQTVNIGSNATFTVVATGTDLTYLWSVDGLILDETGPSLTIDNVQPSDVGTYSVTVQNEAGEETAEAVLAVNCNFAISPSSAIFSSLGGEGAISISAVSDECEWAIENTNTWIQIQEDGTGSGSIDYTVSELPDKPRVGYLKIAGQSFRVTQGAAFAPNVIAGNTLAFTITEGSGTLASSGAFLFAALPATNTYRTTYSYSTNVDTGVYSYEKADAITATLVVNTIFVTLNFTSPTGGTFSAEDEGGSQSGTFILTDTRADINIDGRGDILFQRPDGAISTWYLNGTNFLGGALLRNGTPAVGWSAISSADFNNDGRNDILFQASNAKLAIWYMNKTAFVRSALVRNGNAPVGWRASSVADFDHNGTPDILFQHTTGKLIAWLFNGTNYLGALTLTNATGGNPAAGWRVVGTADFNGDGETDILLQHTDTRLAVWYFVGGKFLGSALLRNGTAAGTVWKLLAVKDFTDDGRPDLLFQHATNNKLAVWVMNDTQFVRSFFLRNGTAVTGNWKVFGPK